jgi:replicative DNA helicase
MASLALAGQEIDIHAVEHNLAQAIAKGGRETGEVKDAGHYVSDAEEELERRLSGIRPGRGLGFGERLDQYTWLEPGNLSIIAGRPGSGKTALVISSILQSASKERPEVFFSMEMPVNQVMLRMACCIANVSYADMAAGLLTTGEGDALRRELQGLAGRGIFIDSSSSASMSDVLYRTMYLSDHPVAIWIDYAELVTSQQMARRDLELTDTYYRGKAIAKDLYTHCCILAQLKREVDERPDKWPTMADVSQSDGAAKAADYLGLIMRPEYYLNRGEEVEVKSPGDRVGVVYYIAAKNRNGVTGWDRIGFNSRTMNFYEYRFRDVTEDDNEGE